MAPVEFTPQLQELLSVANIAVNEKATGRGQSRSLHK